MTVSNRYALLIGVNHYKDPSFRQLITPEEDIKQFQAVLGNSEIGDYAVQPLFNENNEKIQREIERFYKKANVNDTLLLYYTGHGIRDDMTGELYFATANTEKEYLQATSISSSFVKQLMHHSRAIRKILILDCCFSGAISERMLSMGEPINIKQHFLGSGVAILTASSAFQYAFEGESASVLGPKQASIFTRFIVQGLETGLGGREDSSYITIEKLSNYVIESVKSLPDEFEIHQTPELTLISQQGDIIIAANPKPLANFNRLPRPILEDLESEIIYRRKAVVDELTHMAKMDDELAYIAYTAIKQLSTDPDKEVSDAAINAIRSISPARAIIPSAARYIVENQSYEARFVNRPPTYTLTFDNINDYLELFRWTIYRPEIFKKYKDKQSVEKQKELIQHAVWLTTTLTWSPLLFLSAFSDIFRFFADSYESKIWRLIAILALWILTGLWGTVLEDNSAIVSIIISGTVAFVTSASIFNIKTPDLFSFLICIVVIEISLFISGFQRIAFNSGAIGVGLIGVSIGVMIPLGGILVLLGGGGLEAFLVIGIIGAAIGVLLFDTEKVSTVIYIGLGIGAVLGSAVGLITDRFMAINFSSTLLSTASTLISLLIIGSIVYQSYKDIYPSIIE